VSMAGTGVAVDAPMLTAPVGVDRLLESDIGGVVRADDAPGPVRLDAGGNAVGLILDIPAIVHGEDGTGLEAPRRIGQRAAPLKGLAPPGVVAHGNTVRPYSLEVKRPRRGEDRVSFQAACAAARSGGRPRPA